MSSLFKLRNLLLLLAVGLAAVLAAVVAMRYQPQVVVTVAAPTLPSGVNLALQKIDYTHTEGGIARWRLVASRAEHQAESRLTMVKDLELTFFDEDGERLGDLKARSGQLSNDYSEIEVRDGVTLLHRDGYTLQSSSLRYKQQDGMIRTEDPVRLTGRDLTLDGVGLRVDLAGRKVQILHRVHAVVSRKSS